MIKIVFIVPDPRFRESVARVYEKQERAALSAGGENAPCHFQIVVAKNKRYIPHHVLDADVIIGRGTAIEELKRIHPHTSIVEVPVSGEMVSALVRAREAHPGERVAVLGSQDIRFAAGGMGQALGMDVLAFKLESNDDISLRRAMERIFAAGIRVVVCGPATFDCLGTLDCHPFLLDMFDESIEQALVRAKRLAAIRRRQRVKAAQFQAVLNSGHEGIVATDADGRVTIFNRQAAELLRIDPGRAIGAGLREILPLAELSEGAPESDKETRIVPLHGEHLSVKKTAVRLAGEFCGHIITLQGRAAVRRIESQFRSKLHADEYVVNRTLDEIVGDSPAIRTALASARAFAASDASLLIVGEPGTGRRLFAEGIHRAGSRRGESFVAVDCGMEPAELLERKLFGCPGGEGGDCPGAFEIAYGGTLFLEDVAKIPPESQARVAAALREKMAAGSAGGAVTFADIRVMAAAERGLEAEVAAGRFRKDLFDCLGALTLPLPALRERGADILHLAAHFLDEFCLSYRKKSLILSDGACEMLARRSWPGNVDELRSACESLVVRNRGNVVREEDVERLFAETNAGVRD